MDIKELAKYLNLRTRRQVYHLLKTTDIPHIVINARGDHRFRKEDIDKWLLERSKGFKSS